MIWTPKLEFLGYGGVRRRSGNDYAPSKWFISIVCDVESDTTASILLQPAEIGLRMALRAAGVLRGVCTIQIFFRT